MKLLYCRTCNSVFSLSGDKRDCPGCQKCGGYYVDGLNAVWWGDAIPLGFANDSFIRAQFNQLGTNQEFAAFTAFVIGENCPTFKQVENKA